MNSTSEARLLAHLLSPSNYADGPMAGMPDFAIEFDADYGDVTLFARWCDPWIVLTKAQGETLEQLLRRYRAELVGGGLIKAVPE